VVVFLVEPGKRQESVTRAIEEWKRDGRGVVAWAITVEAMAEAVCRALGMEPPAGPGAGGTANRFALSAKARLPRGEGADGEIGRRAMSFALPPPAGCTSRDSLVE
jgi:hypothetical protein